MHLRNPPGGFCVLGTVVLMTHVTLDLRCLLHHTPSAGRERSPFVHFCMNTHTHRKSMIELGRRCTCATKSNPPPMFRLFLFLRSWSSTDPGSQALLLSTDPASTRWSRPAVPGHVSGLAHLGLTPTSTETVVKWGTGEYSCHIANLPGAWNHEQKA